MPPTIDQLKSWLSTPVPPTDLRAQIRAAAMTPRMLVAIRATVPDVLFYSPADLYPVPRIRAYRRASQLSDAVFRALPAMPARAVVEYILGDQSMLDPLQDLLWAICEETSWVLPAHEEQGPDGTGGSDRRSCAISPSARTRR